MSNAPSTNVKPIAPAGVVFTEEATLAVARMREQLNRIRYDHGQAEAGRAALTMAHCLANLVVMGGTVFGDRIGDSGLLNLIANTRSGMTVGMVWFPERLATTLARTNPDMSADEQIAILGEDTVAKLAESGEWSLHS